MLLLIFALFLLNVGINHSLTIQVNPDCDCGVPNDDLGQRIVGGKIADAHRYPWMVAILGDRNILCGGALISDRYVLTAGHCVKDMETLDVLLGKHDLSDAEEGLTIPAAVAKVHPDFFAELVRDIDDIALIKLGQPINYTRNIRPICLPDEGRNYTNRKVQLAGWGNTLENGDMSKYLKETTVDVISMEECAKTKNGPFINENMLCTYTYDTDSCQGDSGGPLHLEREHNKFETIGVVSWGFGCAERESPGVYTKVVNYLDWILAETQDSVYCKNN